ncbi:hypothetical protein LHFGNBLO_003649 [Mesorhizobium sp. AR10]|uniref:hypothetical protein n=1 Tax=Mesorhizobium sp. AR10 TaxID=2865839 RepID=UPI0021606583|nr:hypothetical protein [Mesorhizobium sp. AR10]UVK36694.1 hypothetical protein LHFGNBLO_003649 [Mesorhizobium sp. AR10]
MTMLRKVIALAFAAGIGSTNLTFADEMTPEKLADARTKVETAVALANIAKADKDGEAMLVAARMLAEAGPVAEQGTKVTDGKPTLMDAGKMAIMAKEMGADAKKADAVASTATSAGETSRDGYWYYSCDSYNNCQWIYAGY